MSKSVILYTTVIPTMHVKTYWFCYKMHLPYSRARVYSGHIYMTLLASPMPLIVSTAGQECKASFEATATSNTEHHSPTWWRRYDFPTYLQYLIYLKIILSIQEGRGWGVLDLLIFFSVPCIHIHVCETELTCVVLTNLCVLSPSQIGFTFRSVEDQRRGHLATPRSKRGEILPFLHLFGLMIL